MATFPGIQYSERTPSGRTGAVPLPMQVDTGAQAIAQGIMNVGLAFGEIGQKAKQAQDAMNLSVVERDKDMLSNATIEELKKSKTAEDAEKIIEAFKAKGETLASKHSPEVQRAYTINFNNNFGQTDMVFRATASAAWAKDAKDQFDYALQKAVESGDELSAYIVLSKARATDIIGEEQYGTMLKNIPTDMVLAKARISGEQNPAMMLQEVEAMKVTTEYQAAQKNNVIATLNGQLNRQRSALKDRQDKDTLSLYETAYIKNEPLTWEMVAASSLPAEDKIRFFDNYRTAQAENVNMGISRMEEGDPVVLAKVNALIDLRPGSVTPQAIYAMADKGLGTKHIPGLVDRLQGNLTDETKNPIRAKYIQELSRLYTAGVFNRRSWYGTGNKEASVQNYLALNRKLEAFLASKPTMEAANTFFGNLIKEDVRTWGSLGGNALPGWDDMTLAVDITSKKTGETRTVNVQYGDIILLDGQYLQAVGRKEGKVEWRPIPKPL